MAKYITYDASKDNIRKTFNMLRRSHWFVDKLARVIDKESSCLVTLVEVTRRHIVFLEHVPMDDNYVEFTFID